ncbi:MAG TPA: phosphopantetheine-binding protein, partial [Gemmataceae bacterium]|nr:phosphopantetheine-binding protein [Gemmataceae bacterium]
KPFPTYTIYILDKDRRRLPDGEVGEICIGGPGVGVGYLNRPELTQDRFVPDPFAPEADARLYRTGDLGRFLPDGDIEFLGRIDTQIKFRGYRMEPAEVEAVLLESPEVENAVVVPLSEGGVVVDLAAYVTLDGSTDDPAEVRERLHATMQGRLPAYMVPAYLEVLDAFPLLPSNKVDRKLLPAPSSPRLGARPVVETAPATPMEHKLATVWGPVLNRENVSVEADFFYDLGGHSLAAAQVISHLRRDPELAHLGIGDLYAHPTIRALAGYISQEARGDRRAVTEEKPASAPRLEHSSLRVWACGAAQFGLGYLFASLLSLPFVLIFLAVGKLTLISLFVCAFIFGVCWMPLSFVLPVAFKWLLIGRFRPGRYPLWGWYYCRWWLARKAIGAAPTAFLAGSPLMGLYLRLLGARIGKGCHIGSPNLHLPDLIEIGDNASIGYGAELKTFTVENGWLHVAPIRIGAGAFVGTNALVTLGGSVGDNARVLEQSLVAHNQAIPANETWTGSPSQRLAGSDAELDAMERQAAPERWSPPLLAGFAAAFLFLILLPLLLIAPGLVFLYLVSGGELLRGLLFAPVAGILFVLTTWLGIAAARKLITPRVKPGLFPLRSSYGLRKWLSDKLTATGLGMTTSAFGTLYVRPWLRLLGVRMGARAEVSTVAHIDPDLLELGPESFTADLAVIGSVRYHNGMIALGATKVGARTFVGNSALLPGGTQLPDRSLIGVLSVAPTKPIEAGSSWLGSPAIFLPRRQESAKFDESVTFRPPARLYALRLSIEFFRLMLPAILGYALLFMGALSFLRLASLRSPLLMIAVLPALYLILALLGVGVVVALKWLIVGRYRPRVEPLWSH